MTDFTKRLTLTLTACFFVGLAAGVVTYFILRPAAPVVVVDNDRDDDGIIDEVIYEEEMPDEATDDPVHEGEAPLYMTTMTHMEGIFKDDQNQSIFTKHVADIRWAMDLFDEYGAKLTIESEEPFALANTKWGVPILKEIVDRGHGVGSHADFGYNPNGDQGTLEELTSDYKSLKKTVDAVVGAENNIGSSGGTGQADWVLAAAAAGYKFKDGLTGLGYLAMPESARPSGWTDSYIKETGYHDAIPPDFTERLYPIPLKDATDLVADENAIIVVMGGDLGELASLSEGRINCFPSCTFDGDDIAAVTKAIQEADSLRDRSRVARLNMHIPLKLLTSKNETLLRQLLKSVKAYVDNDTVTWATQKASYEGYLEWNR